MIVGAILIAIGAMVLLRAVPTEWALKRRRVCPTMQSMRGNITIEMIGGITAMTASMTVLPPYNALTVRTALTVMTLLSARAGSTHCSTTGIIMDRTANAATAARTGMPTAMETEMGSGGMSTAETLTAHPLTAEMLTAMMVIAGITTAETLTTEMAVTGTLTAIAGTLVMCHIALIVDALSAMPRIGTDDLTVIALIAVLIVTAMTAVTATGNTKKRAVAVAVGTGSVIVLRRVISNLQSDGI